MSFNSFFREEIYLFKTCNHVLDLVMLSVMWVFCSLPILTMGAATAALYFTVVKGMRAGETLPYGRFLRSFKENLKAGILRTLISAAAVAILGCGVYMLRQAALADSRYAVAYVAYCVGLLWFSVRMVRAYNERRVRR